MTERERQAFAELRNMLLNGYVRPGESVWINLETYEAASSVALKVREIIAAFYPIEYDVKAFQTSDGPWVVVLHRGGSAEAL